LYIISDFPNVKADRKKPSAVLASNLKPNYSTIINELMLTFFGWIVCIIMSGLPLPNLFLKAHKRTECFTLKLNTYLAFKIIFNKERLPLFPIHLAGF
jgi:hypothetical protein